ncbi:hypothetical protein [Streptomyces marincola]|uniref:Uncharacterized protein n=1 Tax=Streptomyces marincola TaxID=2878388 RepID=A0A1W7D085_9ACTN|nr:hypothetical protein [Streptomyces marincola]ARQ70501.1 hypothetical protein CAG99_18105 [Streptomyces marincola]
MSRPAAARAPAGPVPAGACAPWAVALRSVPRALLLPDPVRPYRPDGTGPVAAVRRAEEPERRRAAADADVPVVTQWGDDAQHRSRTATARPQSAQQRSSPPR